MISAKQRSSSKYNHHLQESTVKLEVLPAIEQSSLIPLRAIFIQVQNQILIMLPTKKKLQTFNQ